MTSGTPLPRPYICVDPITSSKVGSVAPLVGLTCFKVALSGLPVCLYRICMALYLQERKALPFWSLSKSSAQQHHVGIGYSLNGYSNWLYFANNVCTMHTPLVPSPPLRSSHVPHKRTGQSLDQERPRSKPRNPSEIKIPRRDLFPSSTMIGMDFLSSSILRTTVSGVSQAFRDTSLV